MPRKGENIFKRKDGRWEARYIHHYENGVAKYRYIYGATYTQAKRKRLEDQAIPRCSQPAKRTSGQLSFAQISSEWLEHIRYTVKESTYARYHHTVQRYLLPYFSTQPACRVCAAQANVMAKALLTEGGCKGKPLAPKTVSDILCVFAMIGKYGNEKSLWNINIKAIPRPPQRKKPIETLDVATCQAIEGLLLQTHEPLYLGILFALFSGVRIGELCGIRWEDIDLSKGIVTIKRTVERIPDTSDDRQAKTKVIMNTPKTAHSYRIIPLQGFLVRILYQSMQPGDCYLLTGTPKFTEPYQYYMRDKTFLKKNHLGDFTFHPLRHTFATRCIEAGFVAKSLSEILGHSSVATTMSLYVHPSIEQKRAQMEKIIPSVVF